MMICYRSVCTDAAVFEVDWLAYNDGFWAVEEACGRHAQLAQPWARLSPLVSWEDIR